MPVAGSQRSAGRGATVTEHLDDRRRRLMSAVAVAGREVVLAYSSGRRSILGTDAVWWMTGFKAMSPCVAVLSASGDAELFVREAEVARAGGVVEKWMRVHPVATSEGVLQAASAWIGDVGVAGTELSTCGLDGLSERLFAVATELLPSGWLGSDRMLADVARRRDKVEIEAVRKATGIAERAYEKLVERVAPGVPEYVLAAWIDSYLKELGSEDNFLLCSTSLKNRSVHPPTARTIELGDVFLAEISPSCDGVFTQICRSVAVGVPAKSVREDYATLLASLREGLDACGPGAAVASVVRAMDRVLDEAGFGDYCRPPYMRARGHGLGIGSVLPGDVTRSSDEALEVGDVLVLHPNQYLPASGYLLCGEPILVTADGVEMLSSAIGELGVASVP